MCQLPQWVPRGILRTRAGCCLWGLFPQQRDRCAHSSLGCREIRGVNKCYGWQRHRRQNSEPSGGWGEDFVKMGMSDLNIED